MHSWERFYILEWIIRSRKNILRAGGSVHEQFTRKQGWHFTGCEQYFLTSKIAFKIYFSSVLEVLEAPKIGLWCAASDGSSEKVRRIEKPNLKLQHRYQMCPKIMSKIDKLHFRRELEQWMYFWGRFFVLEWKIEAESILRAGGSVHEQFTRKQGWQFTGCVQ